MKYLDEAMELMELMESTGSKELTARLDEPEAIDSKK